MRRQLYREISDNYQNLVVREDREISKAICRAIGRPKREKNSLDVAAFWILCKNKSQDS